ncbi:hypothetical protein KDA_43440 [Dictyobacter alpinus]|uniref:Uncharacterized protein n=1 Tax=Dictyobacter alpinus TaxID=2014873 RepID=A0A402BC31_9CHLR|nr:hypothetical protein KDA_43440 [Dictyobacter alpinus]
MWGGGRRIERGETRREVSSWCGRLRSIGEVRSLQGCRYCCYRRSVLHTKMYIQSDVDKTTNLC